MTKVAFIGAGSWGTTTAALIAARPGVEAVLWARRPEQAETINLYHENPQYLPDIRLPDRLRATNDLGEALSGATTVVMAVPSHGFREVLCGVAAVADRDATYLSLTKGIEVDSRKRMTEIIADEVDGIRDDQIAVLSGPNLAGEVVRGHPAASTIASRSRSTAARLQKIFHTSSFRCYRNEDVVGSELGGAFKNVVAIAAGVADGLGYGDNTKATVITRGLAEMARFGVSFGAQALTFLGLAGVGDIMATCASPESRNHSVGIQLGKGRKIDEILADMKMVAEGVKSCRPIWELGQEKGVWMPITENVVNLCHDGAAVEDIVQDLLAREISHEFDGVEEYFRYRG